MGGRKCLLTDAFAALNFCLAFCSILLPSLAASLASSFPSTQHCLGHHISVMFLEGLFWRFARILPAWFFGALLSFSVCNL